MRKILIFVLGFAACAFAGGEQIGVGGSGVCGLEAAVFDGQAPYVAQIANVASDLDVIQVNTIALAINHADGDEVRPNILVPIDGPTAIPVFVSPHSQFQVTTVVRPHVADLGLPPLGGTPTLPMRFTFSGNVIFNAFTDHATVSGTIDLGSIGDICHVLTANPATCTAGAGPLPLARLVVLRHRKIRHLHHLRKTAHPITPTERAALEAALGPRR